MIKLPITAVRFRPAMEGDQKAKHIVLVAGSGGVVQHWHLTSGRMLHSITEKDNQVYSVDYRQDSRYFATGGKDSLVRLYDETTKQLVHTMSGGNGISTAGHANRIFTTKFHPFDDNILLSGGWDNTVQVRKYTYLVLI
jgi:COMPASS component SWD3